jgi:dTDP-4-amino-4,6-dideoxygalactose transaminase
MSRTHQNQTNHYSRRAFIKTGALAATGLSIASYGLGARKIETLALGNGPKSVRFPEKEHNALIRWPRYGEEEKQAVSACIDTGGTYSELAAFEKEWKEYLHAPFVKSHMNGTSALTSMYFALSLDLPPGSEVMVPSYTFFATIAPLRLFNLVPVFVDIDPRTACFDLEDVQRKLTPRTRVLVPMHSWGMPCEMDRILAFAKEKGLVVCEDAAHAHGASIGGKKTGTFGDMAIFSFQQSKVMPLVEGGAGVYQSREYYERATAYGHYEALPGYPVDSPIRKYEGTGFGQKLRMHPFAAALGRVQLRKLDTTNHGVARRVRELNERLLQLPGLSEPWIRPDMKRVYYAINQLFLDEKKAGFTRDQVSKALKAEGVKFGGFSGGYPEQHKFALYSEAKWWHHPVDIPKSLPGTEQVNRTAIHLPLFYEDQPELMSQYVTAFEKVWAHRTELAKL